MPYRIILVDDHAIVRDGLKALIENRSGFQIVGQADNGREAIRLCEELGPDMIIMDVGMPDLNGIEATRMIVKDHPGIKILALSMHTRKRFVLEMLKAGALGYLLKNSAFKELSDALDNVIAGKPYISPEITTVVLSELAAGPSATTNKTAELTSREREILQLLAEGRRSKEISEELHISIKTVQTHRRNIMEKLNIHTLPDLTRYALQEGLISPEI